MSATIIMGEIMYKVDNAIILAAGTASRFAPLSYEKPKALIEVRGEVLIERQIKQLQEAGIKEIVVVTGYMSEQFEYLAEKYNVILINNVDYLTRNNHASIYAARDYIKNSYICSSDNYFENNPFEESVKESYYAVVYASGETKEWCVYENEQGYINKVEIGGNDAWYMLGHVFWDENYSKKFLDILNRIYDMPETFDLLWEHIYIKNLDVLRMKTRKYAETDIWEFDTLDELRLFDSSYVEDTQSHILKYIAAKLGVREEQITNLDVITDTDNAATGFTFLCSNRKYRFNYEKKELREL